MDRILKTGAVQTFLILFSPFLFIILVMFILSNSGQFDSNVFMIAGMFYVYPQMFIMTYWPYYVSHEINKKLIDENKQDLKRFDKLFRIARFMIIGCFISAAILIIASKIDTPPAIMDVLINATLPFNIGQLFILINMLMGFHKLSKMIELGSDNSTRHSNGIFTLFFFLPFTIGSIQKK